MVAFLPFPGIRPDLKDEKIEDRVSPPYDVIDETRLAELRSKEHNVTRLTLMPENGRYVKARAELDSWMKDGSLRTDGDSFYLYRQRFADAGGTLVRTGLVGILGTEPYGDGNIIPHEETFSKVKEDRLNLLRDIGMHLESIFGIYEGCSEELADMISRNAEPLYSFTDEDGVEHEYMRIRDADTVERISAELEAQSILIADGHHRYETALNYSLENPGDARKGFVLATLVAAGDEGLVVRPTHRLLRSGSVPEEEAVERIGRSLRVRSVGSAEEMMSALPDHLFGIMFGSGRCFLCDHEDGGDPLWSLDTYVAQELVIKDVYGYDDGGVTVEYDADRLSAEAKMRSGGYDAAIFFNSPSLKNIWDLSAAGRRMPKKTTFFYPKIWSGFVFYSMV